MRRNLGLQARKTQLVQEPKTDDLPMPRMCVVLRIDWRGDVFYPKIVISGSQWACNTFEDRFYRSATLHFWFGRILLFPTKNFLCPILLKLLSNERWRLVRSQKHRRCLVMLIFWKIWPKEAKTRKSKKSKFFHFASNGHIIFQN